MFSNSKLIIRNWAQYVTVSFFIKNTKEIKVFMYVMRKGSTSLKNEIFYRMVT